MLRSLLFTRQIDIHIVDGELSPLAALTIHFRTAKELSLVDAHWTSEIAGELFPQKEKIAS